MGAEGHAYVVLGIRCRKSDFFNENGVERRCGHGHPAGKDPFCSKDGSPFMDFTVEKPTPQFEEWARLNDSLSESPFSTWEWLCEGEDNHVGVFQVGPIESGEHPTDTLAFGFRILKQWGEAGVREGDPMELKEVVRLGKELKEHAKALGLNGDPKLYLTFYWSV